MRLALLLLLAGCSRTGLETEDDAGIDAGLRVDAGVTRECESASECGAVTNAPRCWGSNTGAGRSCLEGRCVLDCEAPRSCETGDCTQCANSDSCTQCQGLTGPPSTGRLYRSCSSGELTALGGFSFTETDCVSLVTSDAGVSFTVDNRGSGHATTGDAMDPLCTVTTLVTALNRVELGCKRCVYLLEWP